MGPMALRGWVKFFIALREFALFEKATFKDGVEATAELNLQLLVTYYPPIFWLYIWCMYNMQIKFDYFVPKFDYIGKAINHGQAYLHGYTAKPCHT